MSEPADGICDTRVLCLGNELIPNDSLGCIVAERIRTAVWNLAIPHPFTPFKRVTVSIGIAVAPSSGATAVELFNDADRALYAAKSGGRNCTTMQHVS